MSFTSNPNLKHDPALNLRDQRHASRLFTADQFRLAPKQNFLFHVAFGINKAALINSELVQRYGNEINMLVKSADLPNITMKTDTVHQYNRKKNVQYTSEFTDLGIKFHDDNMGLINHLWQNYYTYYYADPRSAKVNGSYSRNATKNSNFIPTAYGLDNKSTRPFFDYIKIYQMARHEYVEYFLHNPIITNWNHNKVDYSSSNTGREFDMKIKYEAVSYSQGSVNAQNDAPEGFGQTHYDFTPSPLSGINPDPSTISPSFVAALDIETLAPGIINSVIQQINSGQNTKQSSAPPNASVLSPNNTSGQGGLQGYNFPQDNNTNNTTTATPRT
jgi:hypothetical protein